MRILHIITRFRSGGSERNLLALLDWERQQGHEVHLAVGRDSNAVSVPDGVTVHPVRNLVRSVHPLLDMRARRGLRRIVREGAFDVVHTHQSKAGILGRHAARGNTRAIVHTVHMASFGPGYRRTASFAFTAAERYCAGFTDMIVCVGEELKDLYLGAGVGRTEQYSVVRSPIDIDAFAAARSVTDRERESHRALLGVEGDCRVIVAVGALEPRKRPRLILKQLASLLHEGGAVLLIAGDGPERPALEAFTRELALNSQVRLLGHLDDIPSLLACADVFVHAATVEGVPQTVVQAIAAGVPVVATDTVGLHEVPGASVTVVPDDGKRLAEAVSSMWQSPTPPVESTALDLWRPEEVARETARFHSRLEDIVSGATGTL